jgi:hypothetical protein
MESCRARLEMKTTGLRSRATFQKTVLILKMEAVRYFETPVNFYRTSRHHIRKFSSLLFTVPAVRTSELTCFKMLFISTNRLDVVAGKPDLN